MLHVIHPRSYLAEREYILGVVLGDFLGLAYTTETSGRSDTLITLTDDHGRRELIIADNLFSTPESEWLTTGSLPHPPFPLWDVDNAPLVIRTVSPKVPLLFTKQEAGSQVCTTSESVLRIELDIFGSVFFLLTRYEEVAAGKRDRYGRFRAQDSVLANDGLLQRPLANEYVEILWGALSYLWPGLRRRERSFRLLVTHDVDWPLYGRGRSHIEVVKSAAGDALLRYSPKLAWRKLLSHVQCAVTGDWAPDIYNTFDFLMTESERANLRSAFYFITDHTGGAVDGNYDMSDPWVRQLMRRIHGRGHEIGLHPSFNSFQDPAQICKEFSILRNAAEEERIYQEAWGGRQHYLRWEADATWRHWSDVGLSYDSSVGFAELAGFRAGTCYEYQAFSLTSRRSLPVRERPLIAMDVTVLGKQYMDQTLEEAFETFARLKAVCKAYRGDFTLLWHNSELWSHGRKELYHKVLLA